MRLHKKYWPKLLLHRAVKGVGVGICVENKKEVDSLAHAHVSGPYKGWICFQTEADVFEKDLILHELAHLITPGGHTDKWRKTLLSIGGSLSGGKLRDYNKKPRKNNRICGVCGKPNGLYLPRDTKGLGSKYIHSVCNWKIKL